MWQQCSHYHRRCLMKGDIYSRLRVAAGLILVLTLLWACAAPPGIKKDPTTGSDPAVSPKPSAVQVYGDFIIVTAGPEDSLDSFAERHLHDSDKAWIIEAFNDVTTAIEGQELVIPLEPPVDGGLSREGHQTVPVLLYHDFSKNRPGKMRVTEKVFEEQMRFLKENGYQVITLAALLDFLELKEDIPPKSVVITIDDGWKSLYTIAYPILKKYGFPVTLFVYTDFVGGNKALSWGQIRELSQNGFDIQCHTISHRYLTKRKKAETFDDYFAAVEKEVVMSRAVLQKKTGITCDCLAYPYGKTNGLVMALIRKHGYLAGFTVTRRSSAVYVHPYLIGRSVIYGQYDLDDFKRNLKTFKETALP